MQYVLCMQSADGAACCAKTPLPHSECHPGEPRSGLVRDLLHRRRRIGPGQLLRSFRDDTVGKRTSYTAGVSAGCASLTIMPVALTPSAVIGSWATSASVIGRVQAANSRQAPSGSKK